MRKKAKRDIDICVIKMLYHEAVTSLEDLSKKLESTKTREGSIEILQMLNTLKKLKSEYSA